MASKKQKNRPTPPPARLDSRAGRAKLTELHQIMLDQIRDKNPARRYINGPQIMEQLGVSKSTMLRLIATMRDDYKLPVDHIKERGGYGYTEEVTEFPAIQFSQAELIAIFAALNSLKSIRGNPFNDSARSCVRETITRPQRPAHGRSRSAEDGRLFSIGRLSGAGGW
jgi:predicted DNA-binding transcriptional regulator YafY